ncbi:MAG: hypothetical protein WD314_08500 [Trueperaceae bacterium]
MCFPLSSNVTRIYTFQVYLPAGMTGLSRDNEAQAEQIGARSIRRIAPEPVGWLAAAYLTALDRAFDSHLAHSRP